MNISDLVIGGKLLTGEVTKEDDIKTHHYILAGLILLSALSMTILIFT